MATCEVWIVSHQEIPSSSPPAPSLSPPAQELEKLKPESGNVFLVGESRGTPCPHPPGVLLPPQPREWGRDAEKGGSGIGTAGFTRHPLPVWAYPAPWVPLSPGKGLSLGMKAEKVVLRAWSGAFSFSDHFLAQDFQAAGPSPAESASSWGLAAEAPQGLFLPLLP